MRILINTNILAHCDVDRCGTYEIKWIKKQLKTKDETLKTNTVVYRQAVALKLD